MINRNINENHEQLLNCTPGIKAKISEGKETEQTDEYQPIENEKLSETWLQNG